jgi:hypothetical protein
MLLLLPHTQHLDDSSALAISTRHTTQPWHGLNQKAGATAGVSAADEAVEVDTEEAHPIEIHHPLADFPPYSSLVSLGERGSVSGRLWN